MAHFIIMDRANGLLQHTGEYASADEAFAAFGADLGYEAEVPGTFERGSYAVMDVSADLRAKVEAWSAAGSDAMTCPVAL